MMRDFDKKISLLLRMSFDQNLVANKIWYLRGATRLGTRLSERRWSDPYEGQDKGSHHETEMKASIGLVAMDSKRILLLAHGSPIHFVGSFMIVEAFAIRKVVEKAIQNEWGHSMSFLMQKCSGYIERQMLRLSEI
ncbi:hypothetical protein H5410_057787 [Solanum commersonii]|uniref:Uncharacterized protein n=1 Tax=Solanum commersonii TaxID=4109 RepID=A0A9J5WQR0_SOLCO|nr:hypothetical protein H5410_057787 [Solanum commersonii]